MQPHGRGFYQQNAFTAGFKNGPEARFTSVNHRQPFVFGAQILFSIFTGLQFTFQLFHTGAQVGFNPFGFDSAVAPTRSVFAVLGIDVEGEVLADGVDRPGALGARNDMLESARRLGTHLVESARARRA